MNKIIFLLCSIFLTACNSIIKPEDYKNIPSAYKPLKSSEIEKLLKGNFIVGLEDWTYYAPDGELILENNPDNIEFRWSVSRDRQCTSSPEFKWCYRVYRENNSARVIFDSDKGPAGKMVKWNIPSAWYEGTQANRNKIMGADRSKVATNRSSSNTTTRTTRTNGQSVNDFDSETYWVVGPLTEEKVRELDGHVLYAGKQFGVGSGTVTYTFNIKKVDKNRKGDVLSVSFGYTVRNNSKCHIIYGHEIFRGDRGDEVVEEFSYGPIVGYRETGSGFGGSYDFFYGTSPLKTGERLTIVPVIDVASRMGCE